MEKINIGIRDNYKYLDVALLVDQIEYGRVVDSWRKEVGIIKPIKLTKYWMHPLIGAWQSKLKDSLISEKESLEAQQWHTENNNKIEIIEDRISGYMVNPCQFFDEVVNNILKKFNKGNEFRNVVVKSLLFCGIKESDYVSSGIRLGVKNVTRDRKWYWWNRRLKKYGYKKIAKLTGKDVKTVEGAIRSYERKLRGLK